jgi:hypothetical protein
MPKRNRFVSPDVKRLPLSDDDWIEVKERLTYKERQQLSGAMFRSVKGAADDQEMGVDFARYAILRLKTWLVDWSFRDKEDKPVPLSSAAIENLDPADADEIGEALDKHIAELEAAKAVPAPSESGKK